jgi:NAD(P)-dependent dehydrogenase (short-subunit alcohol dehydrogenase family)
MIDEVVTHFGRLDAVFTNAGVFEAHPGPNPRMTSSNVYSRSTYGRLLRDEAAIPHLRESGGRAIVNTASTGALAAAPNSRQYVASKHAVLGLTPPPSN